MSFSISSKRIGLRIGWQGARRFGNRAPRLRIYLIAIK